MSASAAGEEAAKLIEALQGWFARGAEASPPAAESAECRICPVCQLIRLARGVRPEMFEHLVAAASEFASAVRTLVDDHLAETAGPPAGVQHIHVAD